MALIHPEAAWALGATGQGITVAVIDVGVDTSQADLVGRLSADAVDLTGPHTNSFGDSHATFIATLIAGDFNNQYTVGVAYMATILSIRVDTGTSCRRDCLIDSNGEALGLDYAINHGAKVINLSFGSSTPEPQNAQDALKRAVDAGAVLTIAAGNDSADNPTYPGRLATDSRYQGSIIVVGALNEAGTALASFSNRAGDSANDYLAAPGENLVADCSASSGGSSCLIGSGTSFSAPLVAGSLALLLQQFPNLSGKQAVDILLQSARDLGAPGVDPIYGHGALDLQRAFSPLGTLSVPTKNGVLQIGNDGNTGAVLGGAFGNSLAQANRKTSTLLYDSYDRRFTVGLGDLFRGPGRRNPIAPDTATLNSKVSMKTATGGSLTLAVQQEPDTTNLIHGADGLIQSQASNSAAISYDSRAVKVDFWSGRTGAAPSFDGAPLDDFTSLAQSREAARVGLHAGQWTISGEAGFGDRRLDPVLDFGPAPGKGEPASYDRAIVSFTGADWRAALSGGQLREGSGPLGSFAPRGSPLAMTARTRFASFTTDWAPARGVSLSGQLSVGDTQAQGKLFNIDRALSTSWRLSSQVDCAQLALPCGALSFNVSQPLRVEHASLSAILADTPSGYFDPVTFSNRDLNIAPQAREIDVSVGVSRQSNLGLFRLDLIGMSNEGNRSRSALGYGASASLQRSF